MQQFSVKWVGSNWLRIRCRGGILRHEYWFRYDSHEWKYIIL